MSDSAVERIQSAAARFIERAPLARWAVYRAPGVAPSQEGVLVRVLVAPGPALGRGRRPGRSDLPGMAQTLSELIVASSGAYGLIDPPRRHGVFTIAQRDDEGVITESDQKWAVAGGEPEDYDGLWRMEVAR